MTAPPAIAKVLRPAEALLWTGRPLGGRLGRGPRELAPLLLAASWLAVGLYYLWWALPRKLDAIFLVPVALVLFGMAAFNATRFARRYRERTAWDYALTSERAIFVQEGARPTSVPLAGIREVSYEERGDGSGTVVLGPTSRAAEVLRRSGGRTARGARLALAPAFEGVADVRAVYAAVLAARES